MKKRPIKVEDVFHATYGVTVAVMLDRETNRFFANYGGRRIEHEACATVKSLVREAIEVAQKLDWLPVIEIERLMPFSAHGPEYFIGFTLDRYYLAFTPEGQIVRTKWFVDGGVDVPLSVYRGRSTSKARQQQVANDTSFVERFDWDESRSGAFRLPYPYEGCIPEGVEGDWRDEQTFYVGYTPELWRALELLQERIEEARRKLDELLLTPDGRVMLEAWAGQLTGGASVFGLLAGPGEFTKRGEETAR